MDTKKITLIEDLSLNAHPALKTYIFDSWILRFAQGFTSRANSVNILCSEDFVAATESHIEEKINFCENLYKKENLPTIFKITPLCSDKLDSLLEQRGYKIATPTKIMTRSLENFCDHQNEIPHHHNKEKNFTIKSENSFSTEWDKNYLRLKGYKNTPDEEIALQIHKNIQNPVVTVAVLDGDKTIACGMAVIEREWVGLYDIFVDQNYRSRGIAFEMCSALLKNAYQFGAKNAYLQVVEDNLPAVKLYEKLGYVDFYKYWYRVNSTYFDKIS